MNMLDIIAKKRYAQALTREEIEWFVSAVAEDRVPDYQTAALLMAIVIQGMTPDETVALTMAMAHSGQILDLSGDIGYAVDKHSSGGVGDKTTLIVLPLVAACGVKVAKMSGRGLGLTGGTLDKLESIPGFNVNLSEAEFRRIAREHGLVLAGQSGDLAPADGKLYALRDVTGTVQSLPLIVGSIMSKKIAAGAKGIVLDVKMGSGAFMKTLDEAQALAQAMVDIGTLAGRDMVATVSDMNQPLGEAVGHALEIRETIETLRGAGPADLRDHCLDIAGHMLWLAGQGGRWTDAAAVRAELEGHLSSGRALAAFREMVRVQGGDVSVVDDPTKLPTAAQVEVISAEKAGYVAGVSAEHVARAAFALGAGRVKKGEPIDFAVGVEVHVKVGEAVQPGQPLLSLHVNDPAKLAEALPLARAAVTFSDTPVEPPPHTYDTIKARAAT
ncbi:MAG: thymidine phosphorylase [Anaerolineae bacterium]|jgi:pyrimidine-nucleoside phosphorylase|nr:thymidine phosphorylase [Anaerolineae bacterium]